MLYDAVGIQRLMPSCREVLIENFRLLERSKVSNQIVKLRSVAIKWISYVVQVTKISAETRDTAIQIFHAYMGRMSEEYLINSNHVQAQNLNNENNSLNIDFPHLSAIAAVAVIVASKIHEVKSFNASNFPAFHKELIFEYERHLLSTIGFRVISQATPATFIRHMLELWPFDHKEKVMELSDQLVGLFYLEIESLNYSPSVIAIAVLLFSFSKFRIDCTDWVISLPDECLPQIDRSIHPSHNSHGLEENCSPSIEIDNCLVCFQNIYSLYISSTTSRSPSTSPSSTQLSSSNSSTVTSENNTNIKSSSFSTENNEISNVLLLSTPTTIAFSPPSRKNKNS